MFENDFKKSICFWIEIYLHLELFHFGWEKVFLQYKKIALKILHSLNLAPVKVIFIAREKVYLELFSGPFFPNHPK